MRGLGVALATATAVAALTAPSTGAPAVRAAGSPTLSASPAQAIPSELVSFTGTLGAKGVRKVLLQKKLASGWKTTARGQTGKRGGFSFEKAASGQTDVLTRYRVLAPRAVLGSTTRPKVTTPTRIVRTVAQSGELPDSSGAQVGDDVDLTATFSPARPGRGVRVQMLTAHGWALVGETTEVSDGSATVTATVPAESGLYEFRAVADAWRGADEFITPEAWVAADPPVAVTSEQLPEAVIGIPYSGQLHANYSGTWELEGDVPAGLSLDPSSGTLSGTPTGPVADLQLNATLTNPYGYTDTETIGIVVREPSTWTSLSSGGQTTCGIHSNGTGWCWGNNPGTGEDRRTTPAQIPGDWKSLTPSGPPTGLQGDGSGWWWGFNGNHQIGGDALSWAMTPIALDGTWSSLEPGYYHTCGVATDSTGWCWGANGWGSVGDGTTDDRPFPTQLPGQWLSLSVSGEATTCGIKVDHSGWCWGRNNDGELGDGTTDTEARPDPTQVPGEWAQLETTGYHTCGVRLDHTAWCWGLNADGQLGDGTTDPRYLPTQVPGEWKRLTIGATSTCGIQTDGTGWCWGDDSFGDLGTGSLGPALSPTQLPGTWESLTMGCGIQTDHTGWCWGVSSRDEAGEESTTPTQVPGAWASLSPGLTACGVKTDGTGWCWGYNAYGSVGDGTTTDRLAPVLLP